MAALARRSSVDLLGESPEEADWGELLGLANGPGHAGY